MMIGNEPALIGLTILYVVAILGLSVFRMILTEITNAVNEDGEQTGGKN
jgi:Tfp pilus assembly protein PilX